MYRVRLKHTAVENLISDVTFINHDSLNKSNSEVPISGKQLEIIAVRFGFDKPVVNQYSFSNGQRRYLEDILECLNIKNINSEGRKECFRCIKKIKTYLHKHKIIFSLIFPCLACTYLNNA